MRIILRVGKPKLLLFYCNYAFYDFLKNVFIDNRSSFNQNKDLKSRQILNSGPLEDYIVPQPIKKNKQTKLCLGRKTKNGLAFHVTYLWTQSRRMSVFL